MARRATSSTKERTAPKGNAPAPMAAPAAPKITRRGSKAKASAMPAAADELNEIIEQPMEAVSTEPKDKPDADSPSSAAVASADAHAASPAVKWDSASGTASFDWPIIEAVAAASGPNQTMAKLLLAARDEGAKSRWPF